MAEIQAPLTGDERPASSPIPPWVRRAARALPLGVLAYGPIAVLAGALGLAILVPTVRGERPRPGVPPDGFVSDNLSVRLSWERGDAEGDLLLEVSESPDFRHPLVQKRSRSSSYSVVGLARGRTYYWRLEQDDGAVVAFFRTSARAVRF